MALLSACNILDTRLLRMLVTMCLMTTLSQANPYSGSGKSTNNGVPNQLDLQQDGSLFSTRNNTQIIVQRGGLAILPCIIKWNPSATVSWIRRRDFQLLTVGLSTYSSDDRFLVEHARHMGHWSLRLKSVRDEDRGLYECQLSVHPPQSIFVELKVVEAVADIVGSPDLHIDEGSTLRLECRLKRATESPSFVFWYLNHKMVNYDSQDGFSVSSSLPTLNAFGPTPAELVNNGDSSNPSNSTNTPSGNATVAQPPPPEQQPHQHPQQTATGPINHLNPIRAPGAAAGPAVAVPSTSVLIIREVHFKHAGNYTCAPSNARPTSITVHVLKSEKPAAMQHANRSASLDPSAAAVSSATRSRPSSTHPSSAVERGYLLVTLLFLVNTVYSQHHRIHR